MFFLKNKKILYNIIVTLIIFSFLLTGISHYFTDNYGNYIAKVNGQKISYEELESYIQYINDKNKVNLDYNSINNIKMIYLDNLIDKVLLDQYIKKKNIKIEDDEIKKVILSDHKFITHNRFDNIKFHNFLRNHGITPSYYAQIIGHQIAIKNFINDLNNMCSLFPKEFDRAFKIFAQKRKVRLAKLNNINNIDDSLIGKKEIQEYYKKHSDKYYSPKIFKLSYIIISIEEIREKILIKEEEISEWYNNHLNEFILPARYNYSVIQLNDIKDANKLLRELRKGVNFSKLAKLYSVDPISAKQGGYIGWINEDELQNFMELKLANLKNKGEISEIIKSNLGFFIFKLNDIEFAKLNPLNLVKNKILEYLKKEYAFYQYNDIYEKIKKFINKRKCYNIGKFGKNFNFKVKKTEWFNLNDIPKEINFEEIRNLLDTKNILKNEKLNLIKMKNKIIVFKIEDYRDKFLEPIDTIYLKVKEDLKYEKSITQARLNAIHIMDKISKGKNIDIKLEKRFNIHFDHPKYFDNREYDDPIIKDIFLLPPPSYKSSKYNISRDRQGNIILIALDEILIPKLNTDQYKLMKNQFNLLLKNKIFVALIKNLRNHSNIKIKDNF